ncbi:MAG TPA: universal stress protein [Geminicoccaceae bacterium]
MSEDIRPDPVAAGSEAPAAESGSGERLFLVVVDDTEEMRNALHFACRRAERTGGRVAMVYVIEPAEFQHWLGVERVMQDEAREIAEQTLQSLAAKAQAMTGKMPALYIREGRRRDEVLALIEEEPSISVVVLGTASDRQDPGPLVNYLITRMSDEMRVPLTLVPGQLSEAEIDQLT